MKLLSGLNWLWFGFFHHDLFLLRFGLYLGLSDVLVLLLNILHELVIVFEDFCPLCIDKVLLII